MLKRPDAMLKGREIVRGVLLLARFRIAGLALFGDGAADLLSSLAPLLAFPVVLALLLLLDGSAGAALSDLLSLVVALLTPLVISQALAARWGRGERWLRYAVALNWCQWAAPLVGTAALLASSILAALGFPQQSLALAAVLGVGGYALALQWFLARRGLDLGGGQATLFVMAVNAGTGALMVLPHLAQKWAVG